MNYLPKCNIINCPIVKVLNTILWNTDKHVVEISVYLLLASPRTLHTLLEEFLLSCKSVKINLDPHIFLRCEIHTWCELWWFLPVRTPADRPLKVGGNVCSHLVVSSVRLQERDKKKFSLRGWTDS